MSASAQGTRRINEHGVGIPPKRYVKPEVVMFGHLAELTKAIVGGSGRNDSAMTNNKTGP